MDVDVDVTCGWILVYIVIPAETVRMRENKGMTHCMMHEKKNERLSFPYDVEREKRKEKDRYERTRSSSRIQATTRFPIQSSR